jgi:cytochrome b pre-mRNA-processing protein 3
MGRMMGALGGRIGAFREAVGAESEMEAAVARNVFHDAAPSPDALRFVTERLLRLHAGLEVASGKALLEGKVPEL